MNYQLKNTKIYLKFKIMKEIKEIVLFQELDEEGRRVVGSLGYFKVIPEYFKKSMYNSFILNENGWKYYESIGLKHPGRGWVECKFHTKEDLEEKIISAQKVIKGQLKFIDNLNSLIS